MRTNKSIMEQILEENGQSYKELLTYIKELESNYNIKIDNEYSEYVNNSQNYNTQFHNWFKYKEAYAGELVEKLLNRFEYKNGDIVLDPFCGSGTTLVVAKKLGLISYGFDVNPVSAYISKAKVINYNVENIKKAKNLIRDFNINDYETTKHIPKLSILDKIFNKEQLNDILKLKGYLESLCEEDNVKYIFNTAYLSIIEPASNMKKDGNGIKYKKNYKPEDVEKLFKEKVNTIINDIEQNINININNVFSYVIEDTFLNTKKLPQINHVIFSPPYANCFDYCSVYKMELWLGGFVNDYSDFKKLRKKAIRSHVNSSISKDLDYQYNLINWVAEKLGNIELWDDKIPKMLLGYFDDMTKAIKKCYEFMSSNSKCAIVVANSCYKGYVVPTDLILSKAAENLGFKVEEILICRTLKTSSQQMIMNENLKNYLRESIIILHKE